MKTYKLAAMLLGAALMTGIGATSAFAKCDGEKMETPATKCSGEKKAKMNTKCNGEKKSNMNAKCNGEKKEEKPKGKCGQGKCGG
ncbi:hypothetical protein WCX49_01280 [Sulfurimonas sp. HSL-1656]|uniref:hypothetical protein n=1 Tax=Thiomicrolovo subterrani TaxID=3131934 RepID=UPI0031F88977